MKVKTVFNEAIKIFLKISIGLMLFVTVENGYTNESLSIDKDNQLVNVSELSNIGLFSVLPPDMIKEVFRQVSFYDIGRFGQASKDCEQLCNENFWNIIRKRIKNDYEHIELDKKTLVTHLLRMQVQTFPEDTAEKQTKALLEVLPDLFKGAYTKFWDNTHAIDIDNLISTEFFGGLKPSRDFDKTHYQALEVYPHWLANLIIEGTNNVALKIKGYDKGRYGYQKSPEDAKDLNEFLVAQGDPKAIERQILGYKHGICGYEKDKEKAAELFKEHQECLIAIKSEIRWNHCEKFYESVAVSAREFIEKLVCLGDEVAVQSKYIGFKEGWYGYKKNHEEAKEFMKEITKNNDVKALKFKIWHHFIRDWDENEIKMDEIYSMAAELIQNGEISGYLFQLRVLTHKAEYLAHSSRDDTHSENIINLLEDIKNITKKITQEGNELIVGLPVVIDKFSGSLEVRPAWVRYSEQFTLHFKNVHPAHRLVEDFAAQGNRFAQYIKAFGLNYGFFGFKKDREQARQYILDHYIAF